MYLVISFLSFFFPFPTKKQRCTADWKKQVEVREQNHIVSNEGNKKKKFCSTLHSILKTKAPLLSGRELQQN